MLQFCSFENKCSHNIVLMFLSFRSRPEERHYCDACVFVMVDKFAKFIILNHLFLCKGLNVPDDAMPKSKRSSGLWLNSHCTLRLKISSDLTILFFLVIRFQSRSRPEVQTRFELWFNLTVCDQAMWVSF